MKKSDRTMKSRAAGTAKAVPEPTPPAARWVEPAIEDHAAFALEHPETVVTPELWARFEPEIRRRARALEWDAERRLDVEAEIRLRIIEAARGYRQLDEHGEPVFDYLAQNTGYIVQHAAGWVYSGLRRERREAGSTVLLGALAESRSEREEGGEAPAILDPADPTILDPLARTNEEQLYHAVAARLTRTQLRVFRLMREGWDRAQIGQMVGLSRQSIHDHVSAIRYSTLEVLKERSDLVALAEVGSLSTYRRKS
jgi:biotin operon repressor